MGSIASGGSGTEVVEPRRLRKLTSQALKATYTRSEPAAEFEGAVNPPAFIASDPHMEWELADVENGINVLISLEERLEYVELSTEKAASVPNSSATGSSNGLRRSWAGQRTQAASCPAPRTRGRSRNCGSARATRYGSDAHRKFEEHAARSSYAVVLFTADDVGGLAAADGDEQELKPRARQNVVFELGFFVGCIGRARVAVLFEADVQMPSDYHGVVYIELDPGGAWEAKLLLELRSAGLSYDLNKLT